MPKFRKKPVVIEAVQWQPSVKHPGVSLEPAHNQPSRSGGVSFRMPERYYVTTIHGQRAYLHPGDWLLPEPDGVHFYPCKPEVFEATYEPLESE